jgi:hypothetical protein
LDGLLIALALFLFVEPGMLAVVSWWGPDEILDADAHRSALHVTSRSASASEA